MAIAFVKNGGGIADKTGGVTAYSVVVPAGGHALGNTVVVMAMLYSSGARTYTVTDSRGNTYTQITVHAGTGRYGMIFASVLTTALQAGDTITVTSSGTGAAVTTAVVSSAEFSGLSLSISGTPGGGYSASGSPSFSTTPADAATVLIGFAAMQGPTGDTFTQDSDTAGGAAWQTLTRVGTTGGSATSNNTLNGTYKIATSAVAQTWNATYGTARTFEGCLVALKEAVVGPQTRTFDATITRAGAVAAQADRERSLASSVTGAAAVAPDLTVVRPPVEFAASIGPADGPDERMYAGNGSGANANGSFTLGGKFTPNADGIITHVRYWAGEAGNSTGAIWNAGTGAKLATTAADTAPGTGWREVPLTTPLVVVAGVQLIVTRDHSGFSPYAGGSPASSAPHLSGPIVGCYATALNTFPTQGGSDHYWVDVVFHTVSRSAVVSPSLYVATVIGLAATIQPGGAAYTAEILADAPLAYYRLGESAGTNAADLSGNARDGTYAGGPTLAQAGALATDSDKSVAFDGFDDRVNLPTSLPLAGGSITVEFWQYVVTADLRNGHGFALGNTGGAGSTNRISGHTPWGDGVIYWDYGDGAGARVSTSYSSYLNKWTHVCLTFDAATNKHAITLDGVEVASTINATKPAAAQTGGYVGWGGYGYHKARMDEFAVYDTALSLARRLAHFNAASVTVSPAVVSADLTFTTPPVGGTVEFASVVAGAGVVTPALGRVLPLAGNVVGSSALTEQQAITRGVAASVVGTGAVAPQTVRIVGFAASVVRAGAVAVAPLGSVKFFAVSILGNNPPLCGEHLTGTFVCGDSSAAVNATLSQGALDIPIDGDAFVTVALSVAKPLAATVVGQGQVSIQGIPLRGMVASVAGQAALSADTIRVPVTVSFSAAVAGASVVAPSLTVTSTSYISLDVDVHGQAAVSALTVRSLALTAQVARQGSVVANIQIAAPVIVNFSAALAGQASVAPILGRTLPLALTVGGAATVSPSFIAARFVWMEVRIETIFPICGEHLVGTFVCGGSSGPHAVITQGVSRYIGWEVPVVGRSSISSGTLSITRNLFVQVGGQAQVDPKMTLLINLPSQVVGKAEIRAKINLDWLVPTEPEDILLPPTVDRDWILIPTTPAGGVLVATTPSGVLLDPTEEEDFILIPTTERTM